MKEKLQGLMSVGYRGIYISIKYINHKNIQLSIDEKKPLSVKFLDDHQRNAILLFKMRPKNIPRQAFVMINMSCQFDLSTCNTTCSGWVTVKSLHTVMASYPCINHSILLQLH